MLIMPTLERAAAPAEPFLFAPWAAGVAREHRDLVSALPVLAINRVLEAALSAPPAHVRRLAAACVLMADPFLRTRDLARLLRGAGIGRVANFPTLQVVDGDAARALEAGDIGTGRELARLGALASEGFEIVPFACTPAFAREAARLGAPRIVLHPGLPVKDWRQRAAAALALSQTMQALRREELSAALFVYDCPGYGAELGQVLEAADGVVRWDEAGERQGSNS